MKNLQITQGYSIVHILKQNLQVTQAIALYTFLGEICKLHKARSLVRILKQNLLITHGS